MRRVAIAFALTCVLSGCSRGHSDWFRIYEARAAVETLREGPAAQTTPADVERVVALLDQAEAALAAGDGDEVAQIAELTLLRARIAGVGAAAGIAEADVVEAEAALEAATRAVDVATRSLRDAKADLEALNER